MLTHTLNLNYLQIFTNKEEDVISVQESSDDEDIDAVLDMSVEDTDKIKVETNYIGKLYVT